MLTLPDAWIWDFWVVDDAATFHLFYLKASNGLGDPERRHFRAGIGHATSPDLVTWTVVADALVHADPPAPDDLATWTGSIVRDDTGRWRMFYTGVSRAEHGTLQRILAAWSDDLFTWQRETTVVEADARWYEKESPHDPEQGWRDPWVFRYPGTDVWHMLITACVPHPDRRDRGVIGHATSTDLTTWTVHPPLSEPGAGFGHLEVPQTVMIDDRPVIVFSCYITDISDARRAAGERGGIWAAPAVSLMGPFDLGASYPLTGPERYAGRIVRHRDGRWMLLGSMNHPDGSFLGGISDPMPLVWRRSHDGVTELGIDPVPSVGTGRSGEPG